MNLLRLNQDFSPIMYTHNFLNNEEISKILEYSKTIPPVSANVGRGENEKEKYKIDSHIREVDSGFVPRVRKSINKWIILENETNWLFKKIITEIHRVNQENFNYILKFVENLQLTEYNQDQQGFYSKHIDCGMNDNIEYYVDIRKLSFSIQLSDPKDYEGGELIIYNENKKALMPKERGTIIFFSSNLLHEVTPVTKGTRNSIISWVQGPNLR
jgi:PKHD-type hydroxylase